MRKKGFTLAEVLITLAVIGVVAALTIGIFLPKIHSQIRAHQIAIAETKFTKAMEQMALNNAIGPYYESTQEFVDELQNYLKIAKVCDNEHLEECFGYEKIKLSNGEEFEIKDIKSGSDLGMDEDDTNYAETISIVTIDGIGMILSWDKNCKILEPKVYEWNGNTNETTSCVAAIMDINLDKSPNTQNKDIALFGAKTIGSVCGIRFEYNNKKYCWSEAFLPTPMTVEECERLKDRLGINGCYHIDNDYWGGAVKKCGGTAKMTSLEDLAAFASYIYGVNFEKYETKHNLNRNQNRLNTVSPVLGSRGKGNGSFGIWAREQYNRYNIYRRFFEPTQSHFSYDNKHYNYFAICVIR